jgi:hypothetical protein
MGKRIVPFSWFFSGAAKGKSVANPSQFRTLDLLRADSAAGQGSEESDFQEMFTWIRIRGRYLVFLDSRQI